MALSSTSPLNTTDYYSLPKAFHFHSPPSSFSYSSHFLITHNLTTISQKWRTNVSFFPAIFKKGKDANTIKEELLDAITSLDRGADATPQDQQRVDQVAFKIFVCMHAFLFLICGLH